MENDNLNSPGFEIPPELENQVSITSLDRVYNWCRRNSIWPMMFGLACCAIEMISMAASRLDVARFGWEVMRPSPRQADVMIVSGTVTKKMVPQIVRLYNQMGEPKYVIAMGACASGGGPFKEGYSVVSGIDRYIPVDIYIPGCPPTPQALMNGLIALQEQVDKEPIKGSRWYAKGPGKDIPVPVLGPDLMDPQKYELIRQSTARQTEVEPSDNSADNAING
jgi:NADH-quinone oxidoreductase subunit B